MSINDVSNPALTMPTLGLLARGPIAYTTTGSFTTGPTTKKIRFWLVGGGGGGDYGSPNLSSMAAGGGGSGGVCIATVAVSPSTTYSFTIGAAGTAGDGTGPTHAGNGGASTLTIGATVYTANGGSGSVNATAASPITAVGGSGAFVGSGGDLNVRGTPGEPGMLLVSQSSTVGLSGNGGSTMFGGGGAGGTAGNGGAGTGMGGGGGGGPPTLSINQGGVGAKGGLIVEEYQ